MAEITPTEYITRWLLHDDAPAYLREDATWRARHAVADGQPGDRQHYLLELYTLVSYHWNPDRSGIDSYDTRLQTNLTHEQIEAADWAKVAEALVAAWQTGADHA